MERKFAVSLVDVAMPEGVYKKLIAAGKALGASGEVAALERAFALVVEMHTQGVLNSDGIAFTRTRNLSEIRHGYAGECKDRSIYFDATFKIISLT